MKLLISSKRKTYFQTEKSKRTKIINNLHCAERTKPTFFSLFLASVVLLGKFRRFNEIFSCKNNELSEALGVPTSFIFRLWILEHRGGAKNHVDEAGARNLLLQVGCSSRCARLPSVLFCIPHDAPLRPRRRIRVYTCTQHRVLDATCTYIHGEQRDSWQRDAADVAEAHEPLPRLLPSLDFFFYSEQPRPPEPFVLLSPYRGSLSAYFFLSPYIHTHACAFHPAFSFVAVRTCNLI